MPLYEFRCGEGHSRDVYAHKHADLAACAVMCEACGETMTQVLSMGRGLTYFASQGKGKWIHNLGDQPVLIESTAQHERVMKEQGVTWAPPKRGMPGCWN